MPFKKKETSPEEVKKEKKSTKKTKVEESEISPLMNHQVDILEQNSNIPTEIVEESDSSNEILIEDNFFYNMEVADEVGEYIEELCEDKENGSYEKVEKQVDMEEPFEEVEEVSSTEENKNLEQTEIQTVSNLLPQNNLSPMAQKLHSYLSRYGITATKHKEGLKRSNPELDAAISELIAAGF